MPKLEIIKAENLISPSLIEEVKQYAAMPDDSRDAVLVSMLQSAILRLQEYADRALVECTVRQTVTMPENTAVFTLYLGGGDVESVKSTNAANSIAYAVLATNKIFIHSFAGSEVEIVYKTKPAAGEFAKAKATILRYVTALYDGENTEVLNSIMNEML